MANYIFDVECIPNLFSVIFIKSGQTALIKDHIEADIKGLTNEMNTILNKIRKEVFVIFWQDENHMINDLDRLYNWVTNKGTDKERIFIGYNSQNYDNIMIDYIITHYKTLKKMHLADMLIKLKEINDYIIDSQQMFFDIRTELELNKKSYYYAVDLQSLNNLHKISNRVSLKQASISLKWYKLEDYEMPPYTDQQVEDLYGWDVTAEEVNSLNSFSRKVHYSELNHLISYNYNDVFITNALFEASFDELSSRVAAYSKYGMYMYSSPRSGVAEKVIRHLYAQYTGLEYRDFVNQRTWRKIINFSDIVTSNVSFKTVKMQEFLKEIKRFSINPYDPKSKMKLSINLNDKLYIMGVGGLHSKDLGGVFKSTENYIILDVDADSYYPKTIVNNKFKPAHLSVVILTIIKTLLDERLYYKRIKDKINASIQKIVINAIFGKMGDADSIMKDDLAMYAVTVNNQLYLLMLIEDFILAGIEPISANTDGITCKVKVDQVEIYNKTINNWCNRLGFTVEVNRYDLYVRTSVNDYLAKINNNGKIEIKRKGDFDKEKYKELSSGYSYPIVPTAIEEYYLNGIPIRQTLYEATDILDFCLSVKTGKNFKNEFHYIDKTTGELAIKPLTKHLRYYASTSGGTLLKRNLETNALTNILSGQNVTILNKLLPITDIRDYNINYNFYISKCQDMIDKINNSQTKTMKKHSGTLFDNLDDE